MQINKKIFLFKQVKPLHNSLTSEEVQKFKIECLQEKIKINEKIILKYMSDPDNAELITECFKASKTAKNGLSLFSKIEEDNLINKEQPIEIINFFKFTTLLLNKEINPSEAEENYIKAFFKTIVPENMSLSININNILLNFKILKIMY